VSQSSAAGSPSSADSLAELERLRGEVSRLEGRLGRRARTARWRTALTVVCLVLLAIVAPLTIVATWAHDQVADTDRWVSTVAPLADDPAVQSAVSERLTEEIVALLDVRAVTEEAVDALAEQGLPTTVATNLRALGTPLAQGVENFVSQQVSRLVGSDEFAEAWSAANREAHAQMVAVLTGEEGGAVEVEGNAVQLNLAVLIDAVKARLVEAGFALAERIPEVTAQFTLFESADLAKAQTGFRLLSAAARALPILAVLLLVVAVAAAARRRRTLVIGSLVVAGSMFLLGLVLNGFRILYLDSVPTDRVPADAAGAIYDQIVSFIRLNLRAVLVLFLALAAVAWVSGPEPAPAEIRRATTSALDSIRHRTDRAGLDTGAFGEFLGRSRTAIRASVAGVVVVLYALADLPTAGWTVKLLLVAGFALLVLELLARTPRLAAPTDPPPAPDRQPLPRS
jgi:hypothetical protein